MTTKTCKKCQLKVLPNGNLGLASRPTNMDDGVESWFKTLNCTHDWQDLIYQTMDIEKLTIPVSGDPIESLICTICKTEKHKEDTNLDFKRSISLEPGIHELTLKPNGELVVDRSIPLEEPKAPTRLDFNEPEQPKFSPEQLEQIKKTCVTKETYWHPDGSHIHED